MHNEKVLARAFADESVDVERDAFGVSVDDSFHLNELRVHVVRARLGHGRQGVGSEARPRGNTDVTAFALAAEVFSPRIIDDVDFSGRVERIYPCLAIAAQNYGPDVAGPYCVVGDGFDHALDDFFAREIQINAIDLGRIYQPLNVFLGAENRRAAGQRVTANAFEDRRAIVNHVRHHMNCGLVPGDELAVVPDLIGLLDCHAHSFAVTSHYN